MGAFATFLLTLASEALKAAGELVHAQRVDDILKDRPSLPAAESVAYRRALDRLAKRPA
jgi:hypothetical protein